MEQGRQAQRGGSDFVKVEGKAFLISRRRDPFVWKPCGTGSAQKHFSACSVWIFQQPRNKGMLLLYLQMKLPLLPRCRLRVLPSPLRMPWGKDRAGSLGFSVTFLRKRTKYQFQMGGSKYCLVTTKMILFTRKELAEKQRKCSETC